jgi:hypothetical protein
MIDPLTGKHEFSGASYRMARQAMKEQRMHLPGRLEEHGRHVGFPEEEKHYSGFPIHEMGYRENEPVEIEKEIESEKGKKP